MIEGLFSSSCCYTFNKMLVDYFSFNKAVFLTALIDKKKELGLEEFYYLQEDIEKEYGIKRKTQRRYEKDFIKLGFLFVEKKGNPAKNWYKFDEFALLELINTGKIAKKHELGPQMGHNVPYISPVQTTDGTLCPNSYIYNLLDIDILGEDSIYIEELFGKFGASELDDFADVIDDFVVYRLEKNKKGVPKYKLQDTWSTLGRLRTFKRNKDTNFGKNKKELPVERIKQVAVSYSIYKDKTNPKFKKIAEEDAAELKKYGVLENGEWKKYAKMVLGEGFIS